MSIGSFFPLGVGYTPGLAPEVRPVAVVVIDANVTWTVACVTVFGPLLLIVPSMYVTLAPTKFSAWLIFRSEIFRLAA